MHSLHFEQSQFKQDFVVMNQKSGQKAKNTIEKDFYKLMNNSNFRCDFRSQGRSEGTSSVAF